MIGNHLPITYSDSDVICTNKDTGERFLCEMQRLQDSDMDDRLLFYGCSLVHRQVERRSRAEGGAGGYGKV